MAALLNLASSSAGVHARQGQRPSAVASRVSAHAAPPAGRAARRPAPPRHALALPQGGWPVVRPGSGAQQKSPLQLLVAAVLGALARHKPGAAPSDLEGIPPEYLPEFDEPQHAPAWVHSAIAERLATAGDEERGL